LNQLASKPALNQLSLENNFHTPVINLFLTTDGVIRFLSLITLTLVSLAVLRCENANTPPNANTPSTQPRMTLPVQKAYLKASNPNAGDFFGASAAMVDNRLVVGARLEDSAATGVGGDQADNSAPDSGAAYVFTGTGGIWGQEAYIKASNTRSGDGFGLWVAVDGDTLVVGAPFEDSGATGIGGNQADASAPDSGAVYVFTRTAGIWSQQAYAKASNTNPDDGFGFSVDVAGHILIVGARNEDSAATGIDGDQSDNSSPDSGGAYVFTRTDGAWSQEAYVKASNTGTGDSFGSSVAVADDTVFVGARFEDSASTGIGGNQMDNSASDSGAVYVFTRIGGAWNQQAYVKASNSGTEDSFGVHISAKGDTLLVGAPYEDSGATSIEENQEDDTAPDSGAAYAFKRMSGIWKQQAYIKGSNNLPGDGFGSSVAVAGDRLAVGAFHNPATNVGQADNTSPNSGAAYVFEPH
jgi:trimeric autotransporter adhesin